MVTPEPGPDAARPLLRRHRSASAILAILATVAVAAALGWWLLSDTGGAPRNVSAEQLARAGQADAEITRVADPHPDPAQVRHAYEQFLVTYGDLSVGGLEDFSRGCAEGVARDPRILDYCLAFDAYAEGVASGSPWFREADARHAALARAALPPGVDAAARIAEVRALARQPGADAAPVQMAQAEPPPPAATTPASPVAEPAAPSPQTAAAAAAPPAPVRAQPPTVQRAAARAHEAKTPAAAARVQKTAARPVARPTARKAVDRCRLEPTPAARALCRDPKLRAADRRLKAAYEQALAAGVDARELDRQQAEWRTAQNANAAGRDAMARAYEVRIGQLQAAAKSEN
jgi:uncharacterized protein YecT (DUF1311 family)